MTGVAVQPVRTGTDRLAPALVGVGAVAGGVAVALRSPFHPGAWPGCPFHAVTGWYCPLCGSTRAVWALAHGRAALVLESNPLLPLILVLAVWAWLWWLTQTGTLRVRVPNPVGSTPARVVLAAVLTIFWIARNLPGLAVLSPHGHQ